MASTQSSDAAAATTSALTDATSALADATSALADAQAALPVSYVRHVVVTTAPAFFDLPCGDKKCEEGGHDLTSKVMRRLRRGDTTWTGKSRCRGSKKGEPCVRELELEVQAEYAEQAQAS